MQLWLFAKNTCSLYILKYASAAILPKQVEPRICDASGLPLTELVGLFT